MSVTTFVLISLLKTVIALFILLTAVAYTTLFERKLVGHIQNRWGPTRVGPFGLLQPLADGLKFILKEDVTPPYVNHPLYLAAPVIALTLALTSIALIPFSGPVRIGSISTAFQITDVNIGLLIILGITSIGVYGIALAGWASNSKYSLLGSLRASAQMVSYEVALGLSLIGVLIMSQSFSLQDIVTSQSGTWWGWIPKWNLFRGQFVAFFIYICAAFAETNRVPFDLPEAETELVAGYHTEYSSMKFAMFFMAEYANMFTVACLASLLFLGGWNGPTFGFAEGTIPAGLLHAFWFALRIFFFIFLYVWVRGTLPRFRYDQLMGFTWKVLLPLSLANILVTGLVVALRG
jgi:NADH-quinone oxidoreductase subunit H